MAEAVVVEREMKMADDEVFPPPAYFRFSLELRATSVAPSFQIFVTRSPMCDVCGTLGCNTSYVLVSTIVTFLKAIRKNEL